MSITDSIHEPAEASVVMDPQSAAELAQELALVAKSLFAQLLPSTATRAVSGVPTLGTLATSAITPKHVQSQPVDQAPAPIDYQAATMAIPVPEAPAPVAAVAIPVPSLPVPSLPVPQMPEAQPVTQTASIPVPTMALIPAEPEPEEPPAVAPYRPEHHSLAMLEEIGFLDE